VPMRISTAKRLVRSKHLQNAANLGQELSALGIDVFAVMAYFAAGDVVSLGYLTKAELEQPERIVLTANGPSVRPSGLSQAIGLIPPKLRLDAAKELGSYLKPKLQAVAYVDSKGNELKHPVVIYLPSNGRGPLPKAQAAPFQLDEEQT
jgi:hypothetical protein